MYMYLAEKVKNAIERRELCTTMGHRQGRAKLREARQRDHEITRQRETKRQKETERDRERQRGR